MTLAPSELEGWRTRAKALLGTLVEISMPYRSEALFLQATDVAFARIEAVHHAMSFHESESDVRAIARARAGDFVRVSPDTFQTLLLAQEIVKTNAVATTAMDERRFNMMHLLQSKIRIYH